ncbi:MAG TPA: hypothetical protein VM933_10645 [Acidimicrobiales bacterium]|nr:hypothetical protein [Acidimicrobiales bacterium]
MSGSPSPNAVATDRVFPAGVFFAVAVVLHNADHVRRGADVVASDVFWLGSAAIVLEVALVALICQRHPVAPLSAALAGLTLAAGYVLVHFLPERPWLSDPLLSTRGVDPWSVLVASIEIVAALVLGLAGLVALHRLGGPGSTVGAPQPPTRQRTVLHPVALGFALIQVATLAASFAQI